ncbi:MAG: hypothetical protein NTX94_06575, partial [Caldiserica bacterium]|nr:hypothetical protein [Caldisericota bacterium]
LISIDSGKPYVQLRLRSDWQATCQEHHHAKAKGRRRQDDGYALLQTGWMPAPQAVSPPTVKKGLPLPRLFCNYLGTVPKL